MKRATKDVEVDRAIGARLRTLRKTAKMSQRELSDKIGVTFQQIQKYEKGINRLSGSRLVATAKILKCPVSALVGDGGNNSLPDPLLFMLSVPGATDLLSVYFGASNDKRKTILVTAKAIAG